jgi:hypothetical protein
MNYPINWSPTIKSAIDRVYIPDITLNKIQSIRACELLYSLQRLWAAVVEVVENHQLIALLQENERGVAPDEAGATSD